MLFEGRQRQPLQSVTAHFHETKRTLGKRPYTQNLTKKQGRTLCAPTKLLSNYCFLITAHFREATNSARVDLPSVEINV